MFKSAKLLHYAHILFHQNITSYNLKILSKAKKSSKFVDIIAILDEKCRSHFNLTRNFQHSSLSKHLRIRPKTFWGIGSSLCIFTTSTKYPLEPILGQCIII